MKIYEVDNFKSTLRIQKTGVRSDSAIENKQREFFIVSCNSKPKAIVLYALSGGGVWSGHRHLNQTQKVKREQDFQKAVHNLMVRT